MDSLDIDQIERDINHIKASSDLSSLQFFAELQKYFLEKTPLLIERIRHLEEQVKEQPGGNKVMTDYQQLLTSAAKSLYRSAYIKISRSGEISWRRQHQQSGGESVPFCRVDKDSDGIWWGYAPTSREAVRCHYGRLPGCAFVGVKTACGYGSRSGAVHAILLSVARQTIMPTQGGPKPFNPGV